MFTIPIISIFVRHTADCPRREEGELYQKCACWKHLRWRHEGRRFTQATKSHTWGGAIEVRAAVEESYRRTRDGRRKDYARLSVADAVEMYLDSKRGENIASETIKDHERQLGEFAEFCKRRGCLVLNDVDLVTLTSFRKSWLEQFPSSLTRIKAQSRLKSFFLFAQRAGVISFNPASALTVIKSEHVPTLPLDADTSPDDPHRPEFEKLLAACAVAFEDERKAKRARGLILTMRFTGLAIADAVGLERDRLRFEAGKNLYRVVTSRSKTGVDVCVPIPAEVAAEILTVPNEHPAYFFWNSGSGQLRTAVKKWNSILRRVFDAAGLREGHPHQLRDTAAVEWLKAGLALQDVSTLLGHASIKTTQQSYSPWVRGRQDRLDGIVVATWAPETAVAG